MASTPIIVLGAGNMGPPEDPLARLHTPEEVQAFLNIFRKYGHNQIDTARNYSPHAPETAEPLQGQTDHASWAITDTKLRMTGQGSHTAEKVSKSVEDSLRALKVDSVNTMYLHVPDRETPLEETCRALDAAHKAGKFKNFGLSNFRPDEVENAVQICKEENLIPPTVYQGQYNAIARLAEEELIPTLRKHGIAYYAYSPGAGGMFSGNTQTGRGRFGDHRIGQMYAGMYHKPDIFESTQKVFELAQKHGISGHAVALRWILHHSALDASKGDAIIIGASSNEQLAENLEICKQGPLPEDLVSLVKDTWPVMKHVAPIAFLP